MATVLAWMHTNQWGEVSKLPLSHCSKICSTKGPDNSPKAVPFVKSLSCTPHRAFKCMTPVTNSTTKEPRNMPIGTRIVQHLCEVFNLLCIQNGWMQLCPQTAASSLAFSWNTSISPAVDYTSAPVFSVPLLSSALFIQNRLNSDVCWWPVQAASGSVPLRLRTWPWDTRTWWRQQVGDFSFGLRLVSLWVTRLAMLVIFFSLASNLSLTFNPWNQISGGSSLPRWSEQFMICKASVVTKCVIFRVDHKVPSFNVHFCESFGLVVVSVMFWTINCKILGRYRQCARSKRCVCPTHIQCTRQNYSIWNVQCQTINQKVVSQSQNRVHYVVVISIHKSYKVFHLWVSDDSRTLVNRSITDLADYCSTFV